MSKAHIIWGILFNEDFEKIAGMLRDNHSEYKQRRSRGTPRDGKALLQGIAYCGHCGPEDDDPIQRQASLQLRTRGADRIRHVLPVDLVRHG